jgi:WD40 repeat protein
MIIVKIDENIAIISDEKTGLEIAQLVHDDRIWSCAISPDFNYVATGSRDTSAKLWDAKTGKLIRTILGEKDDVVSQPKHYGYVWSVAFSSDSRFLATGGYDGFVRIWDIQNGAQLLVHNLRSPGSPLANPPGLLVKFSDDDFSLTISSPDINNGVSSSWIFPCKLSEL